MLHIEGLFRRGKLLEFLHQFFRATCHEWLQLQQTGHGVEVGHLASSFRMPLGIQVGEKVMGFWVRVPSGTVP